IFGRCCRLLGGPVLRRNRFPCVALISAAASAAASTSTSTTAAASPLLARTRFGFRSRRRWRRRLGYREILVFHRFRHGFCLRKTILETLLRRRWRPTTAAVARIAPAAALVSWTFQMLVIGGLDIRDVQEAVAADAEIHERCLNARLDINDAALVNVADVAFLTGALDVQLFEDAVF